jgi:zinc protease
MTCRIFARLAVLWLGPLFVMCGCTKTCYDSWLRKDRGEQLPVSHRISEGVLDNGVKYFFMENKKPDNQCFIRLNVAVGSFAETDKELGIAHMIEHLAFNQNIAEWFQNNGMKLGADANAFTSTENTVYKINLPDCREQSLNEALHILRYIARDIDFSAIDQEKNIIDAEEQEYNNADEIAKKEIVDKLYSGTLYASRPVLGQKNIRAGITIEMLQAFYQKWYHPNNLSIIIVGDYGDLDPKTLIIKEFSDLHTPSDVPKPAISPAPDYKNPIFIVHNGEIASIDTVFTVQAKQTAKPIFKKSLLKDRIAFDLALFMLKEAYESLVRASPSSTFRTSIEGFMFDRGVYELSLDVTSDPHNASSAFLDAFLLMRQAAEFGFDQSAFLRAQSAYADSILQQVIEEPTLGSDFWIDSILTHVNRTGFALSAEEYQKIASPIVDMLSAKDCQEALKKALASGNQYLFAIGAIEDTKENISKLSAMYKTALHQKLESEAAKSHIVFKYGQTACSDDQVVKQDYIKNIDTYQVTLGNQIHVLLKPTKFKKDEILLEVISDQGFMGMSPRDYEIARLAAAVLLEGGLSLHPPKEIPILLSNKQLSLSLAILDNRLQATIATRNQDVPFALQLIKAFIMDPGYAETALSRMKEQIKTQYAELEHSILTPLQNDFLKAITKNDSRVGFIPLNNLLSITRSDLLSFHQRYISSRPLRVVVVGDFDREKMAKELNCIFGSLPTYVSSDQKKYPVLGFSPNIHKVYEVKTKDASSVVMLRYPLNFPGKIYPEHRLALVQNVIQEALRLQLREKKQITYSPTAAVVENKKPFIQNWMDISLAVSKENAEKARSNIMKILERFAVRGITAKALAKAKGPYLAQLKKAVLDNGYWASMLANNFEEANKLSWVATLTHDAQSIGVRDLNRLLKQYFHMKNASTAIVYAVDRDL